MVKKKKMSKSEEMRHYKETYVDTDLAKLIRGDGLSFSKYVIKHRAIPDIRDGLIPVQRRIAYTLAYENVLSNKNRYKTSRVEGLIMRIHPHGSSWGSINSLSQPWNTPLPMIDMEGNIGSILGDGAAAGRYTEIRLSKIGDRFVKKMTHQIVDYKDTFDGDFTEPEVLPVDFPSLLMNYQSGIAVGMTTDVLPNNPREVLLGTIEYLKNPSITVEELMNTIKGPDFITGGIILNSDEIINYYNGEAVRFKVRGRVVKHKNHISITEVPFSLIAQIDSWTAKVADMILEKKIKNAKSIKGYSDANGINIEVEVKRGCDIDALERELYSKTRLEDTVRGSFLVIKNGIPKNVGILEYLECWSDFQNDIIIREHKAIKAKTNNRLEQVSSLIKAFPNIDIIIDVIKNSKSESEMKHILMTGDLGKIKLKTKKAESIVSKFDFTEVQASYILNTRLMKLSNLDKNALVKESKSLEATLNKCKKIITSPAERRKMIIKVQTELLETKEFSEELWKRKTSLTNQGETKVVVDNTPDSVSVSIDKFGQLLVFDNTADTPESSIKRYDTDTADSIFAFSADGNLYRFKLKELKIAKPTDDGISLSTLGLFSASEEMIDMQSSELILESADDSDIIQITSKGIGRIINTSTIKTKRKKCVGAKLTKDEKIIYSLNKTKKYIILVSNLNKVKKIAVSDIPTASSKTVKGNMLAKLDDGEKIVKAYNVSAGTIKVAGETVKVADIKLSKTNTKLQKIK